MKLESQGEPPGKTARSKQVSEILADQSRSGGGGRGRGPGRWWLRLAIALAVLGSAACAHLSYTGQAVTGGVRLLLKRQPIEQLLEGHAIDATTRRQLELVREVLAFAASELELPGNGSYHSYVELDRPYVVWNVVAAPRFSLEPLVWCFPFAGCVSYRGYFSERRARRFGARLEGRGYDVAISGVAAYSTLGWFDDPVLSTFLGGSEGQLAALLIHELAHQKAYVKGDTRFNESLASVVEELGVKRFLAASGRGAEASALDLARDRERQFDGLLLDYRRRFEVLYATDLGPEVKEQRKAETFAQLREDYQQLRDGWTEGPVYDGWFRRDLNNADLASIADYTLWVPALRELFSRSGDFAGFFATVAELARLPRSERERRLEELSPEVQTVASRPGDRESAERDRGSR